MYSTVFSERAREAVCNTGGFVSTGQSVEIQLPNGTRTFSARARFFTSAAWTFLQSHWPVPFFLHARTCEMFQARLFQLPRQDLSRRPGSVSVTSLRSVHFGTPQHPRAGGSGGASRHSRVLGQGRRLVWASGGASPRSEFPSAASLRSQPPCSRRATRLLSGCDGAEGDSSSGMRGGRAHCREAAAHGGAHGASCGRGASCCAGACGDPGASWDGACRAHPGGADQRRRRRPRRELGCRSGQEPLGVRGGGGRLGALL